MANRSFTRSFYTLHEYPVLIDCNFIVDSANGNGFGVRSLKGPGVQAVFMHTTATPGTTKSGILNPNPPAGYIYVQLQDNYNRFYGGSASFGSPLSGTPLTSITANSVYVIVSLGTATAAQWTAAGLPAGVVPSVGASFVAKATGTIGGSATVEAIATTASNIDHIEVVGDPNQTCSPQGAKGAIIISVCLKGDAVTAPTDGTVISLQNYMSNGSNTVAGE